MKLTYDDFKNRRIINISEDAMRYFMDKSLDDSVKELTRILGKKPELRDINEFLIANILDFSKNIKELKNEFFSHKTETEKFVWNLIVDNDTIVFDSYIINMENKEIVEDFSYGVHLLDNEQCETTLDVSEKIKNDESVNLSVLELGIILRLLAYIILISDGHIK